MLGRLLAALAPPLCAGCGADAGPAAPLCGHCRAALRPAPRAAAGAWAAFAYAGPAAAMVRALKFDGRVAIADGMAALIAARAPERLAAADALVPAPAHPRHRRRRGFDQARALADALAPRLGIPVLDCLERAPGGRPQVGRGRRERMSAVDGRIGVRGRVVVPPCPLVVDDVVTTGATVSACAQALRDAGARAVLALAFAATEGR